MTAPDPRTHGLAGGAPPAGEPEGGLVRRNLVKAVTGIVVLVVGLGVIGYFLERELVVATNWVVDQIGFPGLCLVLFATDSVVTPFPPDVLLLVIAKSKLAEHWWLYVGTLGLVSIAAGSLGWLVSRWLGGMRWAERRVGPFKARHGPFIRRYGFWAVVLGAVTPLPYSVTCWGAGLMGLKYSKVLWASLLFRLPRFLAYYWVIVHTEQFVNG